MKAGKQDNSKFKPDEYFVGLDGLTRVRHTKIDISRGGFDIVYDKPPKIPGIEIKNFYSIIDLLNIFPEFGKILNEIDSGRVGKTDREMELWFEQAMKDEFSKLPYEFIKSLTPIIKNRTFRGFALHPGLRWPRSHVAGNRKYLKKDRGLFINMGKRSFRSLIRDIIMLEFFNKNSGTEREKLASFGKVWPEIATYYELPLYLPDSLHLTRHLKRIKSLVKA